MSSTFKPGQDPQAALSHVVNNMSHSSHLNQTASVDSHELPLAALSEPVMPLDGHRHAVHHQHGYKPLFMVLTPEDPGVGSSSSSPTAEAAAIYAAEAKPKCTARDPNGGSLAPSPTVQGVASSTPETKPPGHADEITSVATPEAKPPGHADESTSVATPEAKPHGVTAKITSAAPPVAKPKGTLGGSATSAPEAKPEGGAVVISAATPEPNLKVAVIAGYSPSAQPSPSPCPTPGGIIRAEQLQFVKNIGQGAFSVLEHCIYAPDALTAFSMCVPKRHVAVKQSKPARFMNPMCTPVQLRAEAELLKTLHHKNIVAYIGYGYWSDHVTLLEGPEADYDFLVEEFMGGGSLEDLVMKEKSGRRVKYSILQTVGWMTDVAEGLSYLHASKPMVIHRDLKLGNVLLQGGDLMRACAKIGDVGLSVAIAEGEPWCSCHVLGPAEGSDGRHTSELKRTSAESSGPKSCHASEAEIEVVISKEKAYNLAACVGSYTYMAPEVFLGKPYNEQADVYSFSIMLYELLHHRAVVSTLHDQCVDTVKEYARDCAELHRRPAIEHHVPPALSELMVQCWDHEPSLRPSMPEVVERLRSIRKAMQDEEQKHLVAVPIYAEFDPPNMCGCTIS